MAETNLVEQRAWRAFEADNYEEAARLYEPLAARGSETALLNLGWMYNNGHLGPPDREKAMSLWEEAAKGGSATAKHFLGVAWKQKGDLQRARALFIEGAELGHKACMSKAGKMLVRGEGGEADSQAGVAWLVRAADSGQIFAQRELMRLEIQNSRSLLGRLWLYCKVIWNTLASIPRFIRNPYSDDFY